MTIIERLEKIKEGMLIGTLREMKEREQELGSVIRELKRKENDEFMKFYMVGNLQVFKNGDEKI